MCVQVAMEAEGGTECPRAGVTSGYEPADMAVGKQTQVLGKNVAYSEPPNYSATLVVWFRWLQLFL